MDDNSVTKQLAARREEHERRLFLREMAAIFGSMSIPLTLIAVVLYTSVVNVAITESQFWLILKLVPLAAAAALMLLKPDEITELLGNVLASQALEKVVGLNQASSRQIGWLVVAATVLAFLKWFFLLKMITWLAVGAWFAFQLSGVKAWLAQEPDLSKPPTRADLNARQAEAAPVADEVQEDPVPAEDTVVADDADEVVEEPDAGSAAADLSVENAEPVVLANPGLESAMERLETARSNLAKAEAADDPNKKRIAGLKGTVTRAENAVRKLGGDPGQSSNDADA